MKKIIALSTLAVSLAASSVFGQGWMQLSSGFSQALDGFTTPGTVARDSLINVALLWAPSGTANPLPLANSPTAAPYSAALSDWAAIPTGAGTAVNGFNLATDAGGDGNTAGTVIQVQTTSRGVVAYNSSLSFDVTGTTVGESVALMLVGWNSAYATPAAAQAANSAFGWSFLSSYTMFSQTDNTIFSPTIANFGVFPLATIPEPTTLALAGLGGLSLLFLRRKKA
jgi:hypothetical protein